MSNHFAPITAAFTLALVLPACFDSADDDAATPCMRDEDCASDGFCMAGRCVDARDEESESGADDPMSKGDTMPGPDMDDGPTPAPASDDGPAPGSTGGDDSNTPVPECSASDAPECVGSNLIEACLEGSLNAFDCDDVCGAEGWDSTGCGFASDLGHDACLCANPPYGPCATNDDCSPETPICVNFESGSMCSTSCGGDDDCPAPAEEGSFAICGIPYDTYFCLVDCTFSGECPDGTACYTQWDDWSICL